MSATFTRAVRYRVEAVCLTPLRTGGADGAVETVLRDWTGRPFVQGTSLAGALRDWLADRDPDKVESLFGSQQQSGSLMVSDGLFEAEAEQQTRPRLRIDGATGTADDGGKFDVAHIAAGTKLTFTLTWLGSKEMLEQTGAVEQMLAALHVGEIRLGAQKTNGFGRVSLTVQKRSYRMEDAGDRAAWLEDREDGTPLTLPQLTLGGQVVFTLTGRADSILVKAGAREMRPGFKGGNRNVTVPLRENGQAILPGSSVKGAVRARVTAIAELLGMEQAVTEELFGRMNRRGENPDNGLPGKVRFEDAVLSGKSQEISRIRINKFTGGVIRQGLFVEEPIRSEVTLRITLPEGETRGCGLLLYALRDLGLGLYNLGSGGAVGRGYLAVDTIRAQAPDGTEACLRFDKDRGCTMEDPSGLFAQWLDAVRRDEA